MSIKITDIPNPEVPEEHFVSIQKKPKKASSALKYDSKPFTNQDQEQLKYNQDFLKKNPQLSEQSPSSYAGTPSNPIVSNQNATINISVEGNVVGSKMPVTEGSFSPRNEAGPNVEAKRWNASQTAQTDRQFYDNIIVNKYPNSHQLPPHLTNTRENSLKSHQNPLRRRVIFQRAPLPKDPLNQRSNNFAQEFYPNSMDPMRRTKDFMSVRKQIGKNNGPHFQRNNDLSDNIKQLDHLRYDKQRPFNGTRRSQNRSHTLEKDVLSEEMRLRIGQPPLPPLTAYQLFVKDKCNELKRANSGLPHKEILRKVNNYWLYELGQEDKEAYKHKYLECVKNYHEKLAEYKAKKKEVLREFYQSNNSEVNNEDTQAKKEKVKFKTAFRLFKLDNVAQIKEQYPDSTFKERAQIMKQMWKDLSPHSKFLYMKRSRIERQKVLLEKKMEIVVQVQQEKFGIHEKNSQKSENLNSVPEKKNEVVPEEISQ